MIHKNSKSVGCLELRRIFDSMKQASDITGVPTSNISACCKGKLPYAGKLYGLHLTWSIIDDLDEFMNQLAEVKEDF